MRLHRTACFAHALRCARSLARLTHSLTTELMGKCFFVYEMNAPISYHFYPKCAGTFHLFARTARCLDCSLCLYHSARSLSYSYKKGAYCHSLTCVDFAKNFYILSSKGENALTQRHCRPVHLLPHWSGSRSLLDPLLLALRDFRARSSKTKVTKKKRHFPEIRE